MKISAYILGSCHVQSVPVMEDATVLDILHSVGYSYTAKITLLKTLGATAGGMVFGLVSSQCANNAKE